MYKEFLKWTRSWGVTWEFGSLGVWTIVFRSGGVKTIVIYGSLDVVRK